MGVPPPPNHMLMVPPNTSQTLLGPSALGLIPPPLSLPGTALGLPPLHPPMSLPVTSQAAVMPIVTTASPATSSAPATTVTQPPAAAAPAVASSATPVAESETTDVPMAIDGDATPTDEDGTSEASRLGMIHPPSGEPVGNDKGPVENVKPAGSDLGAAAPPGGFLPLSAPPGMPGQFGNHGLLAKDKVDAGSVKEPKSPVAVSSHEAPSTDVKTEQSEKTDPEKMQRDEQSSGQQVAEPGQEACAFDPTVSSSIPLPVGLPGMPSPPVPPRPFGSAPVRFSGPPMFPFENPADGRPGMEFPGSRMMGPDPRMMVPPVGDFRPPNPHDQAIMGGPGEQRMLGGPLEQHMLDGPPEANMMGGLMEHRMHRVTDGKQPEVKGPESQEDAQNKSAELADKKRSENGEASKEWKPPASAPEPSRGPNGPATEEGQGNGEQPWKQPGGFGFFGPPRSRFNEPSSGRDSDEGGFGGERGDRRVFTNAYGESSDRRRSSGRERRSRWSREDEERDRERSRDRSDKERGDRSDRSRGDHSRSRDRERSSNRSHSSPERAATATAETNGEVSSSKPNGGSSTAEVPLPNVESKGPASNVESKGLAEPEAPKEAAEHAKPEVKA
ncbi:hypothetical protein HPB52_013953 [Rhipicephalus sanguineus]|uniref:Eukaryotic translation initiation factor 3 subunit 10 n=1 Tax=Rhipicephalus sanguineus TaxID=34632 RepID=A0A9D4PMG6_RHISA|nr:hypothetical protein HPB52_013953 [Rhipicephalus sanguineus]